MTWGNDNNNNNNNNNQWSNNWNAPTPSFEKQNTTISNVTSDNKKNNGRSISTTTALSVAPNSRTSTTTKLSVAPNSTITTTIDNNMYHALVLDSGPIIRQYNISNLIQHAQKFYTVSAVISEIRDAKARERLQTLPFLLEIRNPQPTSMTAVTNFSRQTGDYASLSHVDLQVLALTYELEKEGCSGKIEHVRTQPKAKTILQEKQKQLEAKAATVEADKGAGIVVDVNENNSIVSSSLSKQHLQKLQKEKKKIMKEKTMIEQCEVEDWSNFWKKYNQVSQQITTLEQTMGLTNESSIDEYDNNAMLENAEEVDEGYDDYDIIEHDEEEERVVELDDDEEEFEEPEQQQQEIAASLLPPATSWATMSTPNTATAAAATVLNNNNNIHIHTAVTTIAAAQQQQQQEEQVQERLITTTTTIDNDAMSDGQFSDAEEGEDFFQFHLPTSTPSPQKNPNPQKDNVNDDIDDYDDDDKFGDAEEGFQFNLPTSNTNINYTFGNSAATTISSTGTTTNNNNTLDNNNNEEEPKLEFPSLVAAAITTIMQQVALTDDTTKTPAILAKERAEQKRIEAMKSVSNSGKQYNSFRNYRDIIKPKQEKPPTAVNDDDDHKEDQEQQEQKDNDDITTAVENKQTSSRILGYTAAGSQHMQEEEDDGQGWVSSIQDIQKMKAIGKLNPKTDPSTIDASLTTSTKKKKKKHKLFTEMPNPPIHQRTACTTTDFAMQNVLLQMNLELLSVDGIRIHRMKTWVMRCGACFMVYPSDANDASSSSLYRNNRRLFCSRCGCGDMMQRIAASVNRETGKLKLHFSKKYKNNLRGTKFSLPKPSSTKVDRYRGDLLLREDQLLMGCWNQKVRKSSSKKAMESIFGCDLAENVGCYKTRGNNNNNNGMDGGNNGMGGLIRVGFGRRNPNAAKGGRERRGKKKKNVKNKACGLRRY